MHSAKWPLQNGGSGSEGKRGGTKEVTHCPVTTFVPPVFALSWGGHFGTKFLGKKNLSEAPDVPYDQRDHSMHTTPWTRVSHGNLNSQDVVVARDRDAMVRQTYWLPQQDKEVTPFLVAAFLLIRSDVRLVSSEGLVGTCLHALRSLGLLLSWPEMAPIPCGRSI